MADPQARLSILIAHHDAAVGGRLCSLLFEAGHAPQLVGTRDAALERARTANPDVMLVSLDVAGRDDLSLCQEWRADRRTSLTPLVMVSEPADKDSRLRALEAGANDFVPTPPDRAELLARVRSLRASSVTSTTWTRRRPRLSGLPSYYRAYLKLSR